MMVKSLMHINILEPTKKEMGLDLLHKHREPQRFL